MKLASNNSVARKRRKISRSTLHYYLAFLPIHLDRRDDKKGSKIVTPMSGLSDKDAYHVEDAPTEHAPQEWVIIPLPAVLGRRNLVESWWSQCPKMNCQARKLCHKSQSNIGSVSGLFVCADCQPLVDSRQLLTLSKAMVHVSLDGSVTITAKHRQIVTFLPDSSDSENQSSNKYVCTKTIGTLTVASPEKGTSSSKRGLWMKFRLQLRSTDQTIIADKNEPEASGEVNQDHTEKNSQWIKAIENKAIAGSRLHCKFTCDDRQKPKRAILLWDSDPNSDEEEEPMLQEPFSHGRNRKRTDTQDWLPSPARRKLAFGGDIVPDNDRLAKSKLSVSTYNDPPYKENRKNSEEQAIKMHGPSRLVSEESRSEKNAVEPAETSEPCMTPRVEKNQTCETYLTIHETSKIQTLPVSPFTPHSENCHLTKPQRFVTPDHLQEDTKGLKRSQAEQLMSESQHKRRRLAELEEMAGCCSTPRKQPSSLDASSSKEEGSNPSSGPISQTKSPTAKAAPACGGMLSMPDDCSLSDNLSSQVRILLTKEVATQKPLTQFAERMARDMKDGSTPKQATPPPASMVPENMDQFSKAVSPQNAAPSHNSSKVIGDMSLDDWERVLSTSRAGSFRYALSDLIVAKNKSQQQSEPRQLVWLPSLLNPKTRMAF